MRLTVPGNLLLAGEYAVTEEGGLGIACAVEPRVEAVAEPARQLRVTGRLGEGTLDWPGGSAGTLFDACISHMELTRPGFSTAQLPLHITIDSRPFYSPAGRKLGLGSSAAAAVALVATLELAYRHFQACIPAEPDFGGLLFDCISVHRSYQGGRGSGYDVAASLLGGIGLFCGGARPSWRPARVRWLGPEVELRLIEGDRVVRSGSAVTAYQTWKQRRQEEAHLFLRRSNAAVAAVEAAESFDQAVAHLDELRRSAVELGGRIGVPADVGTPLPSGWFCKSVGAGNETVVCIGHPAATLPRRQSAAADGTDRPGALRAEELGNPVRLSAQGVTLVAGFGDQTGSGWSG